MTPINQRNHNKEDDDFASLCGGRHEYDPEYGTLVGDSHIQDSTPLNCMVTSTDVSKGDEQEEESCVTTLPSSGPVGKKKNKEDDILSSGEGTLGSNHEAAVSMLNKYEREQVDEHVDEGMLAQQVSHSMSGEGVVDDSMRGGTSEDQLCLFYRGRCMIHKLKGEKIVTKVKKWVQKKNGLFGYSTTRIVTYHCNHGVTVQNSTSDADNDLGLSQSPVREGVQQQRGVQATLPEISSAGMRGKGEKPI